MKKTVVLISVLFAGLIGFSQTEAPAPKQTVKKGQIAKPGAPRDQGRHEAQLSEMDKVVGLNDDQRNQISKINQEQNDKMKAIRMANKNNTPEEKEVMRAKLRKAQEERKARVAKVLTDEQQVKWKEHNQTKRAASPPPPNRSESEKIDK